MDTDYDRQLSSSYLDEDCWLGWFACDRYSQGQAKAEVVAEWECSFIEISCYKVYLRLEPTEGGGYISDKEGGPKAWPCQKMDKGARPYWHVTA